MVTNESGTHLILIATLGGKYYFYPHFKDEEIKVQMVKGTV